MDIILTDVNSSPERSLDDIKIIGRAAARVCYTKFDFPTVREEKDEGLLEDLLQGGHQSVFEHTQFTFDMRMIPKVGAMLLNAGRVMVTSEKSARYSKMKLEGRQKKLYRKWLGIFKAQITDAHPNLSRDKVKKLAQENARYLTSVFTPTQMLHTMSFRQLCYTAHWFNDFIETSPNTGFNMRIKDFMENFNIQTAHLVTPEIKPGMKKRRLNLFAARDRYANEWGENFSVVYPISFAGLAQSHRHRTLNYQIMSSEGEPEYFVPPIVRDGAFAQIWLADMQEVADDFPQATLVKVHETGNYEDFISKLAERLCGHAQWETMDRTRQTLDAYVVGTAKSNPDVHELFLPYINGPKCTFPDISCPSRCEFGPKEGLERSV
jgi:hypothetical protein